MGHIPVPLAQGSIGSFSSKDGEGIVTQRKVELGYQRWGHNHRRLIGST